MTVLFDPDGDTQEQRWSWPRAASIAISSGLVLAAGLLFYLVNVANDRHNQALDAQRHSYEVIALVRLLDGTVAKSESLLARYVVSMEPNVGRQYRESWQTAGTQIDALRRATRDHPVQRSNVEAIEAAYLDRGTMLNDIALRTTYEQRLGALGRFNIAGKAENLQRLNESIDRMIETEKRILTERALDVDASARRQDWVSRSYSIAGLLTIVAMLAALAIANQAFADRRFARRLAEAEAERVDELSEAVTARTADLEIANERLRQEMAERAQAEENLRQFQKMEAIGSLTGGIAHDFNNMLTVVMGGLELAKRRAASDPAQAERHIDSALDGAKRAEALTRRLLGFARAQPLLPDTVSPDRLIVEMSDLIDRTIGDQIRVNMAPGAGDWAIWVDRHQLENAILNLCVNARDAMDGKGVLTVRTAQGALPADAPSECAAGDYVVISVRDTGCGMDEDVRQRVFEPFFTTKPVGKGTGLGLSQIFAFVQQCGGHVHLSSAPGEGTEVKLYLPRDTQARGRRHRPGATDHTAVDCAPARSLNVLLVEDDPRVLGATAAALSELGHCVISCDHPAKAAATIAANPDIDIILSDVQMPDMTGPEMIAELSAQVGDIPVIFVTGFAGQAERLTGMANRTTLRKPFTLAKLSQTINKVVADRQISAPDPAPEVSAAG